MARPKKEVDEEQVYMLACQGLTYDNIASFFGVDRSTIIRRFAPLIKEGHSQLGEKVRMRLVNMALEKNDKTALIYLDKRMNRDGDESTNIAPVSKIKLKAVDDDGTKESIPE